MVTATQQSLLSAGALKVKLTASGKTSAKIAVKSGSSSVAKSATVSFKKKGSRTVSVKLSTAGKTTLGACGAPKVSVTVTYGKRTARASRTLTKDATRCTTPPPPPPPPTGGCTSADDLNSDYCLMPWPNDFYTKADPTTATGRRLNLQPGQMPRNGNGAAISPVPYNRSDGFSGNSAIVAFIPGLDTKQALVASHIAPIYDIGAYTAADAGVVVINTKTGQRVPIWTEVDANATAAGNTTVLTRGAKVFDENTRYIVAFRNLKKGNGTPIPATGLFKQYRDNTVPATASQAVAALL